MINTRNNNKMIDEKSLAKLGVRKFDIYEELSSQAAIDGYLEASLEDDSPAELKHSLAVVAEAQRRLDAKNAKKPHFVWILSKNKDTPLTAVSRGLAYFQQLGLNMPTLAT